MHSNMATSPRRVLPTSAAWPTRLRFRCGEPRGFASRPRDRFAFFGLAESESLWQLRNRDGSTVPTILLGYEVPLVKHARHHRKDRTGRNLRHTLHVGAVCSRVARSVFQWEKILHCSGGRCCAIGGKNARPATQYRVPPCGSRQTAAEQRSAQACRHRWAARSAALPAECTRAC